MPLPITLDQPITFDSLLCRDTCIPLESTDGSFCFQLPLFEDTGTNLLSLTEVGFARVFQYTIDTNDSVNTTSGSTLCGSPFTNNSQVLDAFALSLQIVNAGQYFFDVELGDTSITYGINPDDDTVGELLISIQDGTLVREDTQEFTEADANSELFFLGSTEWVALDNPSLWIKSKSECDDTNEHIQYDVDILDYSILPNFLEDTFTATNNTFYRLYFKLDKTSAATITITDSSGAPILEDSESGPVYDKIFKTGVLPVDKTMTVRFEVSNLTEWPNTNFNSEVLTEVSVKKLCQWDMDIKDSAGNLLSVSGINITETHDTTAETQGTSYNDNIQYCIDLSLLSAGNYNFVATDSCDSYTEYDSAQFKICDADCDYYSKISWDHGNIKFIGANKLDYFNYTYVPFFRARVDLQDLTQQFETVNYRDAAGYLQNPYTFYRNVQIMQISEVPGYMRRAIALALSDVFMIDGVEYRKLDDEDIAPLFQATDPNAVRIIVTKVGDFTESKNV